jgi:hypothetical protein
VREQCSGFALPPEPYAFEASAGTDRDLWMVEGLAHCLAEGPMAGYSIELMGTSELPGRLVFPVEGAGAADAVRSLLARLGLPFASMSTRDVAGDQNESQHPAPRVVLGAGLASGS